MMHYESKGMGDAEIEPARQLGKKVLIRRQQVLLQGTAMEQKTMELGGSDLMTNVKSRREPGRQLFLVRYKKTARQGRKWNPHTSS